MWPKRTKEKDCWEKEENANRWPQGWVSRKKSNVSSEQKEVANFNTATVEFIVKKVGNDKTFERRVDNTLRSFSYDRKFVVFLLS
jgi:hypothetical protein